MATKTATKPKTMDKSEWGTDVDLNTSFWQTEVNRYSPKALPNVMFKFGIFYSFFHVMARVGESIWPAVFKFAGEKDIDPAAIALPVATGLVFCFFFSYAYVFFGVVNLYFDNTEFFKSIRVHKGDWTWNTTEKNGKQVYWDAFKGLLFNLALYTPQFPLVKYVLGTACPFRLDLDSMPAPFELFWQCIFCTVVFDFVFHHMHKMFHSRACYWIHRKHHSVTVIIGPVGAMYHPIDEELEAVGPALVGPLLLWNRMHIIGFATWFLFVVWASTEIHCGYETPWNMFAALPFGVDCRYHDFHHRYHHRGNYSVVFTIWDYIYGTNKEYYEWVREGGPYNAFVEPPNEYVGQKKID